MEYFTLLIALLGVLIALITMYFSFIKSPNIQVLIGNNLKVFYYNYSDNKLSFGMYIPIDYVNTSNNTGIITKTAVVLYKKDKNYERFFMLERQFSKVDIKNNKWIFDEISHSIVIPPKQAINKIIRYNWSNKSSPNLILEEGEYVFKIYYWTNNPKNKPKHITFRIIIDKETKTKIDENIDKKKTTVISILVDKEYEYSKIMTKNDEEKLLLN